MSLANDFSAGFGLTYGIGRDYRDRKDAKEMQKAREMIDADQQMSEVLAKRNSDLTARQNEVQKNLRHQDSVRAKEEERAAFDADPSEQLRKARAAIELEAVRNPKPLSPEEEMKRDIARMKIEQEHAALSKPPAPAVPTARVKQPFGPGGKGVAEFDAPVDQLPQIMGASPASTYKSPHARRLAELDRTIAGEQAQIDGGDARAGLFTKRADTVATAQRERMRLLALELEDKVRAGVMSQEDADAEADRILNAAR